MKKNPDCSLASQLVPLVIFIRLLRLITFTLKKSFASTESITYHVENYDYLICNLDESYYEI